MIEELIKENTAALRELAEALRDNPLSKPAVEEVATTEPETKKRPTKAKPAAKELTDAEKDTHYKANILPHLQALLAHDRQKLIDLLGSYDAIKGSDVPFESWDELVVKAQEALATTEDDLI